MHNHYLTEQTFLGILPESFAFFVFVCVFKFSKNLIMGRILCDLRKLFLIQLGVIMVL